MEERLKNYRTMRNEIVHNAFRMKTFKSKTFPEFKDYSYSEVLSNLFNKGIEIFDSFGEFMIPGRPSQEAFVRRFKGIPKTD